MEGWKEGGLVIGQIPTGSRVELLGNSELRTEDDSNEKTASPWDLYFRGTRDGGNFRACPDLFRALQLRQEKGQALALAVLMKMRKAFASPA